VGELDGKVAVVTGGSRGIGRAVAEDLAREGAKVILTGRNAYRARRTVREIAQNGVDVTSMILDVSDRTAVKIAFEGISQREGRLDILVNNAGIARDSLLLRLKPEDWDAVIATNLNGLYYCCQNALRPMLRQRSGRIVNMSSVVGLTGNVGQTSYAASKAAIVDFSKALAREVAARNVTVNAVAPGYISTDMTDNLPAEIRDGLTETIPMGRIGNPEDVAEAVLFLVSSRAGYLTGQVLQVNGGMYM
jgi:3-oxoacyl-[acyl-carrier protein] reductase